MVATVLYISAILTIIIGILILIWPRLIRIGLGVYLILVGLLSLLGTMI